MGVLLTIAIPTYKRCKYVVENVKYILPQLHKYREEVRLIVTDNHSEDGSYEELLPIASENSEIMSVYEQKENIGWMNNFFFGIEKSDSEYVFLLGDDDIISPNFLDIVLPMLKSADKRLGMLHFNYLMGTEQLKNERCLYSNFENIDMIVKYNDIKEFVIKYTTGPSFISSVIFRKSCMMKGKDINLQPSTFGYSWFLCLLTGIVDYDVIYYKMPLCVQRLGGFYPGYCTNYVIGMYNVFKYLDPYVPGVLNFWKKHFAKEHDTIAMNINQLIDFRDVYIPHYDLFEESLPCEDLKKLLRIALFWNKTCAKLYFKFYWKLYHS